MHPRYFGDSYDVVKQSLLRWLAELGEWSFHPMFTKQVAVERGLEFGRFLGARCLSEQVLAPSTDRRAYLRPALECATHLFLDPDTGLAARRVPAAKRPAYLMVDELVEIASARPTKLTLMFDQSVPRGREQKAVESKLVPLAECGLSSLAYITHACFLLVGADRQLVRSAARVIKERSRLPESRFLEKPSL